MVPRPMRAVLAVLLALPASPVAAQAGRDTTQLAPRVVTATRVPDVDVPVPAATTVINGADLRARGITFVADALKEVPGMMLVQTGSYGAPLSLFLRGGESNDVKVLLDGVPLNLPGGSINLANLTTDNLDRIEIVRGPASVLYGADAVTGVVQLFTRSGSGPTHGDLTANGGTFGTSDVTGHLDGSRGNWSYSTTGARFASDGIYPFNSGYRNSVGSAQAGWTGHDASRVVFTARYGDAIDHYPTASDGTPLDHNQFTTETSLAVGLTASHPMSRALAATVDGFASRLNSGYQNSPDSPADTSGFGYDGNSSEVTWRRGGDVRVDWRHARSIVISAGAGAEDETDSESSRYVSNYGAGVEVDTAAFAHGRTTTNAFAQLLAEPSHTVSLQAGGRVDDNSAFGTFGTWRIGASWSLGRSTRIWSTVGTAFKAPAMSELFAESAFEVGNPALRPERSTNGEVGLEERFAESRATVSVAAFSESFRDLIQYVSAAPGQPTYFNLGAARSRGVEASMIALPTRTLTVSAHWTFLSTAVTDTGSASSPAEEEGQSLIRRPASSGGATLAYRAGSATLSATLTWIGARDDVNYNSFPAVRVTLPSYATVDAAVDMPIWGSAGRSSGMDLTLRGENLFNAAYIQAVGFPGRGRTLLAGGRLRF